MVEKGGKEEDGRIAGAQVTRVLEKEAPVIVTILRRRHRTLDRVRHCYVPCVDGALSTPPAARSVKRMDRSERKTILDIAKSET